MSANPVNARAYNTFRYEPFGLIRKSSQTERLSDEIGYYKTVQRDTNKAIFFPRLIASHTGEENWLLMERYDYANLGSYLTGQADRVVRWTEVFDELSMVLSQFETFSDPQNGNPEYVEDMLVKKTSREYDALVNARYDLQYLFTPKTVNINGTEYRNFSDIWPEVESYIKEHMLNYESSMIHGDMCFSNILYAPDAKIIKFIDPRGSFGKKGIYGDPRYDIAKLYHSVQGGYEYIINDAFDLKGDLNVWDYELHNYDVRALQAFERKFFDTGAFSKKEITLIQGCIYVGMCARHYDAPRRQEIMYLTGVKLLNDGLNL